MNPEQKISFHEKCISLLREGIRYCIVTVVESQFSVPQNLGAKAIIDDSGLIFGTVGGGKIEVAAISHAQQLFQGKVEKKFVQWSLNRDLGMTCGGQITLAFDIQGPPNWRVHIFGAGHVSQQLIRLLIKLDCQVCCFDHRQEWLDKLPIANNLNKILVSNYNSVAADLPPEAHIVSITQGHSTDLEVATGVLSTQRPNFLGVIGSASKGKTLKRKLKAADISTEQIELVQCPVGLPLGNRSPEEIAISITAQLLQVRDQLSL